MNLLLCYFTLSLVTGSLWAEHQSYGGLHSTLTATRRGVRGKRKMSEPVYLWPNATVPYIFLHPTPDKAAVLSGVQHWERHTCLRFSLTNNSQVPHIAFRGLEGCRSGVGREPGLGQNVSIGDTCTRLGIVVHEIGHAIGFYHEIRRPDRDQYVVINSANIQPRELFNFYKLHWLDTSIQYDLSSVMHYTPMEWTANGRLSVATVDPMLQGVVGQWKGTTSKGLSHRDKLLANTVYGCFDKWLKSCGVAKNPCYDEGYLGEHCKCVCPPGRGGSLCQYKIGDYYDELRSPCSQEVNYDTVINSPNYPYNYDRESWCVWVLHSDHCRAPVLTITDFEMGPKDSKGHCFYDYLEIRTNSTSDGKVKCAKEVTPGTQYRSKGSTMILFFNGEVGGYRGFQASVTFEDLPGCCRKIVNGTATHWLSPGYPKHPPKPFKCSIGLDNSRSQFLVEVSLRSPYPIVVEDCPLLLCLPDSKCNRHCITGDASQPQVLPNSGSNHILSGSQAIELVLTRKPSPCHQTVELKAGDETTVTLPPKDQGNTTVMCEWKLQSPVDHHVRISSVAVTLTGSRSFLAIDEAGSSTYMVNSTRVYHSSAGIPTHFTSINTSISIALYGGPDTRLSLTYSLYSCSDSETECPYWALDGECQRNRDWMSLNCPKSCNLCEVSSNCLDEHSDCQFWAQHGQCLDNSRWMKINCRRACGHCDWCLDRNPRCSRWAAAGECRVNAAYMKKFCAASCKVCQGNASVSQFSPSRYNYSIISNKTKTDTLNSRGNVTLPYAIVNNKYVSLPNETTNINDTKTRISQIFESTNLEVPENDVLFPIYPELPEPAPLVALPQPSTTTTPLPTLTLVRKTSMKNSRTGHNKPNYERSKELQLSPKTPKQVPHINDVTSVFKNEKPYNCNGNQCIGSNHDKLNHANKFESIETNKFDNGHFRIPRRRVNQPQRNTTPRQRNRPPNKTEKSDLETIKIVSTNYRNKLRTYQQKSNKRLHHSNNSVTIATKDDVIRNVSSMFGSYNTNRLIQNNSNNRMPSHSDRNTSQNTDKIHSIRNRTSLITTSSFKNHTSLRNSVFGEPNFINVASVNDNRIRHDRKQHGRKDIATAQARRKHRKRPFKQKVRKNAVEAFMMVPLCAEVRKLSRMKKRNFQNSHYVSNQLPTVNIHLSRKRKMKMYKMLKKIMYFSSSTSFHRRKSQFNRYFNRKLRRVLRRLFRKRKDKLRKQLFAPENLSRVFHKRRERKSKIIESIRRYNLNRIFKLYKINVHNLHSSDDRITPYGQDTSKTTPILCIAAKRITNEYESQMKLNARVDSLNNTT